MTNLERFDGQKIKFIEEQVIHDQDVRNLLFNVAAKNPGILKKGSLIGDLSFERTIDTLREIARNPKTKNLTHANEIYKDGTELVQLLIRAQKQLDNKNVVAQNILGAEFSDIEAVIKDFKTSRPHFYYFTHLKNDAALSYAVFKCTLAALVPLEMAFLENYNKLLENARQYHVLADLFIIE